MNAFTKLFFLICLIGFTVDNASAQLNLPTSSPRSEFSQQFALTKLNMSFSRPGVKSRKIMGGLVPYGTLWRLGANAQTTFDISDDITVNGSALPKGDYIVMAIPFEKEWKIIFNKNPKTKYNNHIKEDDVLILTAPVGKTANFVETFNITTSDIKGNSMKLHIMWENTQVTLDLVNEVDSKIKAEFKEKLAGPNASTYYGMARYLYSSGGDLNKALEYINIAIDKNIGYGNLRYKGLILAKLGRKTEAIEWFTKSKDRAVTYKNQNYVRINEMSIEEVKKSMK